jgi:nitrate reductase NapD
MTMNERAMNVSSLVVKTAPEQVDEVLCALRGSGLCDVYFHDENGRIIVTIEGKDVGEEMRKVKAIQGLPHVFSADLAYSYCEDELAKAREHFIDRADVVPEKLRESR